MDTTEKILRHPVQVAVEMVPPISPRLGIQSIDKRKGERWPKDLELFPRKLLVWRPWGYEVELTYTD